MKHCELILLWLHFTHCTIDLNLSELEYLADHLHPEECRRLVAALHFKSYEQPNALDQAEAKVSKDIPCIRLLLHWNSEIGEGKGETHEAVQHRLRQMGRVDLADWLGKTVFHELGAEMEESLKDPFKDLVNVTEKAMRGAPPTLEPVIANWDPTEWIAFDTICWVFIIGISLFILAILARVACIICIKKKRKTRNYENKNYNELESEIDTDTESEDRFDIRTHDPGIIKLQRLSRLQSE